MDEEFAKNGKCEIIFKMGLTGPHDTSCVSLEKFLQNGKHNGKNG